MTKKPKVTANTGRCNGLFNYRFQVFQRRVDGSEDFNRLWEDYKNGFGSSGGEFWLGNENLFTILSQKGYELRVEMQEWNGTKHFITHDHFRIGDKTSGYRLFLRSADDYQGMTYIQVVRKMSTFLEANLSVIPNIMSFHLIN